MAVARRHLTLEPCTCLCSSAWTTLASGQDSSQLATPVGSVAEKDSAGRLLVAQRERSAGGCVTNIEGVSRLTFRWSAAALRPGGLSSATATI